MRWNNDKTNNAGDGNGVGGVGGISIASRIGRLDF